MHDRNRNQDNSSKTQDTPARSFAKAISWRCLGTIDTFILSFVIIKYLGPYFGMESLQENAGIATAATAIALTEIITKIVLFTGHERLWSRCSWGLNTHHPHRTETHRRTAAKTGSWRILASLDTMFLAWIFTGSPAAAISIGSMEVITKLGLYYVHERIWQRVAFV